MSLNGRLDNAAFTKLSAHLKALSRGSYLYLKLTLDLIEKGYLVLKSSSFKVHTQSHPDWMEPTHFQNSEVLNHFLVGDQLVLFISSFTFICLL